VKKWEKEKVAEKEILITQVQRVISREKDEETHQRVRENKIFPPFLCGCYKCASDSTNQGKSDETIALHFFSDYI